MTALAAVEARTPRTMGFSELRTWLRHRHPMIYLDRVVDYEPGRFLNAIVAVSGALDVMAGHFPERAIYPGSHLIQALSQAAIVLCQLSSSRLRDDELTLVTSIEARFFKVAVPGDTIKLDVRLERVQEDRLFAFSGKAVVDETRVAAFRASLVRSDVAALGSPLW